MKVNKTKDTKIENNNRNNEQVNTFENIRYNNTNQRIDPETKFNKFTNNGN